ncbi:MAG TPA: flagellar hook-associated protein FlgL [Blastocatellia bacterium]|nr:flagellar hook-associated protein FlgL [Blastocatellia bacterium]
MRITDTGAARNFLQNVAIQRERADQLNQQMSSGRKLLRPSDDPLAAQQSLQTRASLSRNDQYSKNTQVAQSKLENVDSIADSLQLSIDQAIQLTTQGLSGSTTDSTRTILSTQIQAIKDQVLSLGNTSIGGEYIFAGSKTDTLPFVSNNGAVSYSGDSAAVYTRIDDNTLAQTNVNGQELFMGSKDIFATLDNIRQALTTDDATSLRQGLVDLNNALDQTNIVRGHIGATLDHLQSRSNDIQQQDVSLTAQQSNLEDANIVQTAVQSNQAQVALQASLNAGARILSVSLLDYLK